jgi:hypothetical protein
LVTTKNKHIIAKINMADQRLGQERLKINIPYLKNTAEELFKGLTPGHLPRLVAENCQRCS